MRIIIVRHAEPDYTIDSITQNGHKEAKALSKRLLNEKIDYIYISPLGRAKATAQYYLDESKKDYQICDWLKEFPYTVLDHETNTPRIPWDFKVKYFTSFENIYDNSSYLEIPFIKDSNVYDGYQYVINEFDKVLEKHGYKRKGKYYEVTNSNKDTLIFFCHLGMESVLLSHLFNLPFVAIAQHFSPSPSSVSIIFSEEREQGIAQFRAMCLGDISHLYNEDIEPSFMGRFRENYFD